MTYEYQVTQPGLQWRWPGPDTDNDGQYDPDAKKVHFWEVEPAQNSNPYPTTAGPGNWAWAEYLHNPPLAAGAFYCLLDWMVIATRERLSRRPAARPA